MSDDIEKELLKDLEELGIDPAGGDSSVEPATDTTTDTATTTATTTPTSTSTSTGAGSPDRPSRVAGLLALILGMVGVLVSLVFGFYALRLGISTSSTVDQAMEPIEVSFDRMETRIDETDDLVAQDGIDGDRIDELQARVDGLVDVANGAQQGFQAIEDHPVYSLLPADLSTLGSSLSDFVTSAEDIDERLGSASDGDELPQAAATAISDELDDMQSWVSGARDAFDDAESSLRQWIRIGSFLGFLGSLWGLWGQVSLAKRGWRGFRGRTV